MIDPQLLGDDPEAVRSSQESRGASVDIVDKAISAIDTFNTTLSEVSAIIREESPSVRKASTWRPPRSSKTSRAKPAAKTKLASLAALS